MRVVASRIGVAITLLAAALYMLQTDDSARLAASRPRPVAVIQPVLVNTADTRERDYFVTHHSFDVIPLGSRAITLPILMYHYIRPAPSMRTDMLGYRLSVTPENFQVQMDWLYGNGYHAVNFNDVRAYFAGRAPLPAKPVVITFDDGYRDLYTTAFPILQAHRFTAVAYIVTSFVDYSGYVTASQLVEMDGAGVEIASHTINHADLAGRSSLATDMYQLVQSKQWLEKLVGHPVVDFAYPSGKFNAQAVAAVQAAGYYSAVTELPSTVHSEADRYTWTRVRVGGGESLSDFIANLGGCMPSIRVTTHAVDVEDAGAADGVPTR